ncbi:MAG: hypothetical protein NTZ18_02705 [Candidatus Komeilibacteria bacterium]|nr:hypothetical protein [Candidatus Komeilibacteria bacterium]
MAKVKTALICEGGGMKSAFAAGAVYELARFLKISHFDILIGASSSAPIFAYFLTGQLEEIKRIWEEETSQIVTKKKSQFLKGEPMFNTDYLVDKILHERHPLNLEKLEKSPVDLFIPFYNFKADRIEFYHNHATGKKINIWQALKATMAIHDHHLKQCEDLSHCVDPGLVCPLIYEQAIILGATHYLVISNQKTFNATLKRWLGFKLFKLFQGRKFPAEIKLKLKQYNKMNKKSRLAMRAFVLQENVLLIKPPDQAKLKFFSHKSSQTKKAITWGRAAARALRDHPLIKIFQDRSREIANQ